MEPIKKERDDLRKQLKEMSEDRDSLQALVKKLDYRHEISAKEKLTAENYIEN